MRDLEAALTEATTIQEAAMAASDVMDELIPGGAAISPDAGRDVRMIIGAFGGDHPFQAFVMAVLVSVARVLGAWERVPKPDADISRLVEAEREARGVIDGFIREQEQARFPYDAEVRSLFYQLIGIVADPETAASSLLSHAESEIDPLARACLFEGLLVAMMRSGMKWQDEVVMLNAAMQTDPRVASRLANVPVDYVGESERANREAVEEVLGVRLPDRYYDNHWPSELL